MNYSIQKRILDIAVAVVLMVAFLPFWIIVPILVFLESGWPVIFSHKRVGQHGKEFSIFKFRSMVKNADEILYQQNPELFEKFKKGDWKLEHDPRITPLGRALRSLTIDEFPQLYNVLRGDMSMIGPRAYLKKELGEQVKKYPETKEYIKDILSVKPGITGVWQTSGRNDVPFNVRAKMDAEYARDPSLWKDLLILAKTPQAMLSRW